MKNKLTLETRDRVRAILTRFPGIELERFLTQVLGDLPFRIYEKNAGKQSRVMKPEARRLLDELQKDGLIDLRPPGGIYSSWRVFLK